MKTLRSVAVVSCVVLGSVHTPAGAEVSSWLSVRVAHLDATEILPGGAQGDRYRLVSSTTFNVLCTAEQFGPDDNFKVFYTFAQATWSFNIQTDVAAIGLSILPLSFNARQTPGQPFWNSASVRPTITLDEDMLSMQPGYTLSLYQSPSTNLTAGPVSMDFNGIAQLRSPEGRRVDITSLRIDFTPIPTPGALVALGALSVVGSVRRRAR